MTDPSENQRTPFAAAPRRENQPDAGLGVTSQHIATVVALVHQRTGLVFPPNRMFIVEAGVRRSMRSAGIRDVQVYTRELASDAALMDELFAELTVGETYFFRDPGQLDVIREFVFPLFREQTERDTTEHDANVPGVRVWSAGCATGEEPYTLAMMLADANLGRQAYVIGTDISRERLKVAQRGHYRNWSMRGVGDAVIHRHFTRQHDYFLLSPAIKQMVEFRYLNLGLDQYPSPALGVWAMDLILCRNVLIYFDEATVATVAQRLLDTLSLRGWLFLGASDPMISDLVACEVVTTPAGLAYRRRRADKTEIAGLSSRRVVPSTNPSPTIESFKLPSDPPTNAVDVALGEASTLDYGGPPTDRGRDVEYPSLTNAKSPAEDWKTGTSEDAYPNDRETPTPIESTAETARSPGSPAHNAGSPLATLYAERDYAEIVVRAPLILKAQPRDQTIWIFFVRALANLGRLAEAERACLAAIERCTVSTELWYLHAILLAESGHYPESAQAARRALYLDREFVVAYLALGTALRKTGDVAQARRAFTNALQIAERLPPTSVVPAADGETAERIVMAARVQLQLAAEVA